jgi:hypothetical protein
MGRGRAKAKQTKVARQLKYNSGGTDLNRLAEELGVSSSDQAIGMPSRDDDTYEDELDDPYAAYADYDDEDEDDPHGHRRR